MKRATPGGRAVTVLLALLLTTAGLLGTQVTNASPSRAGDTENLVKVFVVPPLDQTGGQAVGLAAVAGAVLGDQTRAGEIFQLNQNRRQPDGGALTEPNQALTPGWILRLPGDASGRLVQFARERGDDAVQMDNGQIQGGDTGFPPAAVLAAIGSVLLALITAAIVTRRRLGAWLRRTLERLREPGRRRARLAARRDLTGRFRSDTETVRRAYSTVGSLAVRSPGNQVHALRVDERSVTVWVSGDTAPPELPGPWRGVDDSHWRLDGALPRPDPQGDGTACLVRAGGTDAASAVFVDLSRLDGVLSVTGDESVGRDVVHHLLTEVAAVQPGTPVQVLGGYPIAIPAGLNQVSWTPGTPSRQDHDDESPVRATALRRPVRGIVVVAGTPDRATLDELSRLCGSGGEGWTGLVAGDVPVGAHWRWHAVEDGDVDIPVLDVRVTVPA